MKQLLTFLLCLPLFALAQKTHVPDDVFENYLENNNMGDGVVGNDSVLTANIKYQTLIDVEMKFIQDFTGLADFDSLKIFWARWTSADTVDLSYNTALEKFDLADSGLKYLTLGNHPNLELIDISVNLFSSIDLSPYPKLRSIYCSYSSLTSLDFSNNPLIENIKASYCQLTNINLSNCTRLEELEIDHNQLNYLNTEDCDSLRRLFCHYNNITYIDVSHCSNLTEFHAYKNQLTYLNLQNGNNTVMVGLRAEDNPNLTCVNVDNVAYSNTNWTGFAGFDSQVFFSTTCTPYAVDEEEGQNKTLLRIVDVLGKESKPLKNTPLFYIYDDGTIEQKFIPKNL